MNKLIISASCPECGEEVKTSIFLFNQDEEPAIHISIFDQELWHCECGCDFSSYIEICNE